MNTSMPLGSSTTSRISITVAAGSDRHVGGHEVGAVVHRTATVPRCPRHGRAAARVVRWSMHPIAAPNEADRRDRHTSARARRSSCRSPTVNRRPCSTRSRPPRRRRLADRRRRGPPDARDPRPAVPGRRVRRPAQARLVLLVARDPPPLRGGHDRPGAGPLLRGLPIDADAAPTTRSCSRRRRRRTVTATSRSASRPTTRRVSSAAARFFLEVTERDAAHVRPQSDPHVAGRRGGAAATVRWSRSRRSSDDARPRDRRTSSPSASPNGATIQTGIGAIPNAIMACADRPSRSRHPHRAALRRRGRPDRVGRRQRRPQAAQPHQDGRHVRARHRPAARVPAREHGDRAARRAVRQRPSDHRRRRRNFVSINATLTVDFLGQCASETIDGRYFSSSGGQ